MNRPLTTRHNATEEREREKGNYSLSTSVKSTFFDAAKTNITRDVCLGGILANLIAIEDKIKAKRGFWATIFGLINLNPGLTQNWPNKAVPKGQMIGGRSAKRDGIQLGFNK